MTPHDDDLRSLFHDAVSDVHPRGGPEMIRARDQRPAAARWLPLTVAAAVVTVLVIGGTAWLAQQPDGSPSAGAGQPNAPVATRSSGRQNTARTVQVPVYYTGLTAAGPRLFTETHTVTGVTDSNLDAAVQQALSGWPRDPDYLPWPVDGLTAATSSDGSTLTIDLSRTVDRPSGMTPEQAQSAVQALVWTSDAMAREDLPVRFTVGGQPTAQVLGVDTSSPVEKASADATLSTVSITSPTEGATVPTRFEVTGQAASFEGNVVWELKQSDRVGRSGYTTAKECCTLSPYSFTVTAAPGTYTLVVHDTDESGGEGVGAILDTKQITVE
ncbi:MAG: hypothetical protein JWR90_223 [Marmoricola sp.]|jgi:hypothetical protein|nr:hypothetical protein [Marmoricola sp.]